MKNIVPTVLINNLAKIKLLQLLTYYQEFEMHVFHVIEHTIYICNVKIMHSFPKLFMLLWFGLGWFYIHWNWKIAPVY